MDPITHGLTAFAASKTGFLKAPVRIATIAFLAGALLPDLDIVLSLFGPDVSLRHHRGLTHSIVAAPFFSLIIGFVIYKIGSFKRFYVISAMVFLGVLSHIFLDLITAFGTVIFDPINTDRYSLNLVFILDPFLTIPLIVVSVLIIKRKIDAQRWSRVLLIYVAVYLVFCLGMRLYNEDRLLSYAESRGIEVSRHTVFPSMLAPVRWLGIFEYDGDYYRVPMNMFSSEPLTHERVRIEDENPLISSARQSDIGRLYHWFANYPVARHREEGGFDIVEFYDFKYRTLRAGKLPFMLKLTYDKKGVLTDAVLNGKRVNSFRHGD